MIHCADENSVDPVSRHHQKQDDVDLHCFQKKDSEMSTLLDEPSHKFFLKDLQSCTEVDRVATSPAADAGKIKNWNFVSRAKSVHFCITWIQGVVVKVLESHDSFFLDDGTGVVLVTGYGKISFAAIKPQLGDYMMVVGPLLKSGVCPVVKARKIQNLNNKSLETMWVLEVLDQLAMVANDT